MDMANLREITVVCELEHDDINNHDGLAPGRYPVRVAHALSDTNAARAALNMFSCLHAPSTLANLALWVEDENGSVVNEDHYAPGDAQQLAMLGAT